MDPTTTTDETITETEAQRPAPAKTGSVVTMPSHAMKSLKEKERERGRRAALAELDQQAKANGFKDHADLVKQAQGAKARTTQLTDKPATDRTTTDRNGNQMARNERERARQLEAQRKTNRELARAKRKAKDAERQLVAQQTETQLRVAAARAGIKDVDYAIHVFRGMVNTLDEKQLENFDENQFFASKLRETHPYLYGETPARTEPATTTAAPLAPSAPKQNTASTTTTLDASKLSPQDFKKRLAELGLGDPRSGVVPSRSSAR